MTKTLSQAHPGIAALIHRQHGVLSSRQAAAHGLAHETLRQRVLRGIWQRLLPGVYVLQCGPPTWQQRLIAALVYAGDGSMLTGPAALAEHGLPPSRVCAELPRIDVLVPHGTRRQNVSGAPPVPALRIVRAAHLPAPIDSGPLRLAPLARAVVDGCLAAAEGADAGDVEATAECALADGRVSLADLEAELTRATRRHSGPLRAYLAQHREGARKAAARRLAAAVSAASRHERHGRPLPDVTVYSGHRQVARAAVLWPSRAVAAAVDAPGRELESLERLGFAVVQVTPQNVAGDLPGVLRRIGGLLAERPEATLPAGVSVLAGASAS